MLTEKQKKICEKYRARDEEGLVHCKECPLAIDHCAHTCRSFMHYDRHKREWVEDEVVSDDRE
jgi:hypothetical protein